MFMFAISFASGIWLLQQQASLPDLAWAWLLIVFIAALALSQRNTWHKALHTLILLSLAFSAGFLYAAWIAKYRLADELPATWQGKDIAIVGVIAEMPRQHEYGQRFVFDVEQVITPNAHVPHRIMLSTYTTRSTSTISPHAGERWQLTVRLKQPHGTSNPYSFDFEAWALERNLRAVGYVHHKGNNQLLHERVDRPGYLIERARETIRARFQQELGTSPYAGVLTALAIGDQASIPANQWQIFTRTGVNHLMSISGLHITMLSGMAFAIIYWLWRRSTYLTLFIPAQKIAAALGLLLALLYALLSGYGVPAQRTVYMLATVAAALWFSRSISPSQILAYALMVVLILDPWAVIAPGFWLSFSAVALIFYITANRLRANHWLIEYARIQWAMSIGLIPLLLALFQQVSIISPIANIFAIPLVSFVVIPLTLLGAVLPIGWLLSWAHEAMNIVMQVLLWLNSFSHVVWIQHAPPIWSIVVGMLGVAWILLPRGFPSRWMGFILLLPMFFISPDMPAKNTARLVIFDVGQGLAVSVQTHSHTLLYDSGPMFNSEANSGNRILIPSLRGMGINKLDTLMLTHNDADHTGGALSVMEGMPVNLLSSSLPDDKLIVQQASQTQRCTDKQNWNWDGIQFEVIHPSPDSYDDPKIKDNDRGCVLRISIGDNSVLLAADIEKKSEQRLLEIHADKLNATMLVVPHHGSKTSSTPEFVSATHPRYAVFTVGYRNSFGHPKAEIIERYKAIDSEILRSDEDGAILVNMDGKNMSIERYKKSHAHYWHSPIQQTEPPSY